MLVTKGIKARHGTAELQTHVQVTIQQWSLTRVDVDVANTRDKISGVSVTPFFPISSQVLTHTEATTVQIIVP